MTDVHAPAPLTYEGVDTRDQRLMELVATSDQQAQRQLVDRLMSRVRKATGALLRNPADADDAAQLCMLEVLRSAEKFRGEHEGSLEAWCDRITVRTALRFAKKQARQRSVEVARTDPDHLGLAQGRAAGARLQDEIAGDVSDYLERLPEARREALVLRHVLGYTVAEIAELTKVSPNTVKDRLVQARREFRKMMRREAFVRANAGPESAGGAERP